MKKGYVAFILHAHLPFVRHPEYNDFFEERWLFEAISETYIPLIKSFTLLRDEGTDFKLTMSITPPLVTMLTDSLLQERYIKHLEKLIDLSEMEMARTQKHPEFYKLAKMYNEKYKDDLYIFKDRYKCNIVTAFKDFQDTGNIELIACAATHGYLPLMTNKPEAINAQITTGVKTHRHYFGQAPKGIWLPECGYHPVMDAFLKDNDIDYFITESHGILFAEPKPVFGTFSPIVTPNGMVAFGRDVESSNQVWSASDGYPGDFYYRDFYRDIGYDLDYDYIKNHIGGDGQRIQTGLKYYRITGKTNDKQPYDPALAMKKADYHVYDFIKNREKQIKNLCEIMDNSPIIVCPYDAELFGHWWYEGPQWLYSLFKRVHQDQNTFSLITLSEYLAENPIMQVATPCVSSWGHNGYSEVWLNSSNDWIYRHLYTVTERMIELANENKTAEGIKRDALNQAARELLLAQSSDWAFIMKTGTMVQYAVKRTKDHIGRFLRLYHDIKENNIDENWLRETQSTDNIFPGIDYSIYSSM